jgi:zinc transport system ATP-binding protein
VSEEIISFKNVSAGYGNGDVVENITFSVEKGDYVGVIGPNGGGKSTVLKMIAGVHKPRTGEVRVLGKDPEKFTQKERSLIGYVRQETFIDTSFPIKVKEVVLMGRYALIGPGRRPSAQDEQKAMDALKRTGMENFAGSHIGALSGGQKQRVFIARGILNNPELLILDEPTTGVDVKNQHAFYELLLELKRNYNLTIIMVSHDVSMISDHVNKVTCVNHGVHVHGNTDEILGNEKVCEVCGLDMDVLFHERRKLHAELELKNVKHD